MSEEVDQSERLKVSVDGREGTLIWDGRPRHHFVEVEWDDDRSVSGVIASSKVKSITKQGKMLETNAKGTETSDGDTAAKMLLQSQQLIIDEQRKIIEEQRRIINQRKVAYSDTSSTAGSSRSLPATSISSGSAVVHLHSPHSCPRTPEAEALSTAEPVPLACHVKVFDMTLSDAKIDETKPLASPTIPTGNSTSDLMDALMTEVRKDGGLTHYPLSARPEVSRTLSETAAVAPRTWCHDSPQWPLTQNTISAPTAGVAVATASSEAIAACSGSGTSTIPEVAKAVNLAHLAMDPTLSDTTPVDPGAQACQGYPHSKRSAQVRIASAGVGCSRTTDDPSDGSFLNREFWKVELDSWVLSANVSPRGRWLCTGSEDKTARIYDLVGKAMLQCFPHDGWVWSTKFSPDGLFLCTGAGDNNARVFDVESGREVLKLVHGGVVRDASLNAAGRGQLLLSACQDKFARLFNAGSGTLLRRHEHAGWVLAANWSPAGTRFCTASDDLCARVFDAETGQKHQVFEHDDWVRSASYSPDGNRLCTASDDKSVRVFDLSSGVEIQRFEHSAKVSSADISPDGNWLCTACSDNYAYIFDLKRGAELLKFEHEGRVCSASFSPDGRRLCSASEDGTVRIFGNALQSMLSLHRLAST